MNMWEFIEEHMPEWHMEPWQRAYLNHYVEATPVYEIPRETMPRYPEWFVGGPWHGKDRLKEAPNLRDRISVAEPINLDNYLNSRPPDATFSLFNQYVYVPRHAVIFGERLTVWVGESDAVALATDQHSYVNRLLGQLIMSPHRTDTDSPGFDVEFDARRDRQLFEAEISVRQELERQYRTRLRNAENEITRMRAQPLCGHSFVHPNQQLQPEMRPTAIMEFVDDEHNHDFVAFGNITLFFDDGNDEIPPSWVATAQGDYKPYTGYGTTKRGAIIALLADALDVYARMIETGERIR